MDDNDPNTVETQFDSEVESDLKEVDKELGISQEEEVPSNTEEVEENALESSGEGILEESGNDVMAENLESSPVSEEEKVEEVDQDTSAPEEASPEVKNEEEIEEFLDDKSDESFEKSIQVADETTSEESEEGEGEKEEDSEEEEEFKADDEIIEEENEETEEDEKEKEIEEILNEDSEEDTETVEDSTKSEEEESEEASGVEVPEQEEVELEPEKDDSMEELSPASVEVEKVEDPSETSEYHDELNIAIENAIIKNPNAENMMVIQYDKDDTHPHIEKLNIKEYKEKLYKRQEHKETKTVEEILNESMNGGNGENIKPALEGPILDDKPIAEKLREEAETIIQPSQNNLGVDKNILDGNAISSEAYSKFEHVSFQDALREKPHIYHDHNQGHNHHNQGHHHPQVFRRGVKTLGPQKTKSEQISEQGTQAQDVYLTSHEKMQNALRMFAEHDALKRATVKIPKGIPANVFLSDFMGISGVGEYKPSYNMIKYYGGLSEFHHHFAEQARRQVSFEDIDTLIGLLSDMNGIFTTIYDLLPKKDEIENEKDNKLGKSILDHAYDILRFYSQVRGFVNTVVFNRHLLIQDIRFIKHRVNDLHTDMDDMLYFYSLDVQYRKVKTLGKSYSFDPKIEAFLKRIDHVSVGFGIDVKIILRHFFNFEKAVVFFDTDVRHLASSINVSTPLDAIRTVDSVIMFLIRVIELKIDIFRSLKTLKTSLENIAKHRTDILDNLRGAEQLIHYYSMEKEGIRLYPLGVLALLVLMFFRKD